MSTIPRPARYMPEGSSTWMQRIGTRSDSGSTDRTYRYWDLVGVNGGGRRRASFRGSVATGMSS